jgi:hypothetical protein
MRKMMKMIFVVRKEEVQVIKMKKKIMKIQIMMYKIMMKK